MITELVPTGLLAPVLPHPWWTTLNGVELYQGLYLIHPTARTQDPETTSERPRKLGWRKSIDSAWSQARISRRRTALDSTPEFSTSDVKQRASRGDWGECRVGVLVLRRSSVDLKALPTLPLTCLMVRYNILSRVCYCKYGQGCSKPSKVEES